MEPRKDAPGNLSKILKNLIVPILILGIMICSAYSNTFSSPPVLDDFHTFIEDPLVRIQDWSISKVISLSETKFSWSRFIPMATLSFDLWAGKGELFNFHLTNLIIHLLAFLSVILLTHQICKASELRFPAVHHLPAGPVSICVAGLWALHPVQTNAVTYIVQRMASIAALFTILAVASYLSARLMSLKRGACNGKVLLIYCISALSLVMGLLSKENSAMIPVLIVLTEVWFFQPDLFHHLLMPARKRWFLSAVGGLVVFGAVAYYISSAVIPGYNGRHFTLIERLLTESRIIFWYVSVVLWPDPRRLSLEHDVVVSTNLLNPPTTILSILSLIMVVWWAVSRRKCYPIITYGILWFGLNLAIESSIIPLELIFEHRVYLPSAGLLLSLVVGLHTLTRARLFKMPTKDALRLGWCCVFILSSVLALLTFQRNNDWQDMETLARDSVSKAPKHPRSHANLSTTCLRRGKFQEAIDEAKIAIDLGREHFEQYFIAGNNIIAAHYALDDHHKALEEGERLLRDKPPGLVDVSGLPAFYLNLARAQQQIGDIRGAYLRVVSALWSVQNTPGRSTDLKQIGLTALSVLLNEAQERGLDLDGDGKADPGESSSVFWTAQQFMRLGDRRTAKDLLAKAVAENHEDSESVQLFEQVDKEDNLNRIQEAKKDFTQKYVSHPYSPFNVCMAGAFLTQKYGANRFLGAIGESLLAVALRLDHDSADAHLLKGWLHYSKEETAEAIDAVKLAVGIDPEYARAWLGMGFFLAKAGQSEEALFAFEKTLELYPGYPERAKILDLMAALHRQSLEFAEAQ